MKLSEFHNGLRLLHGIDGFELVGMDRDKARAFVIDPVRAFIRMSHADQEIVWAAMQKRMRPRRRSRVEGCKYCDEHGGGMMPPHDPSPNCQSGKHPHCTCDTCF